MSLTIRRLARHFTPMRWRAYVTSGRIVELTEKTA
jgi:hypothetical protein